MDNYLLEQTFLLLSDSDVNDADRISRIEECLTHRSFRVRKALLERSLDLSLTDQQVTRGLTDRSRQVRSAWASSYNFTPNSEHVEIGLTDMDYIVRLRWISRTDYTLSSEHIMHGLRSSDPETVSRWISRLRSLSESDVDAYLNHESSIVRQAIAQNILIYLNDQQVTRGLSDSDSGVRYHWSMRAFTPTPEQVELMLTDENAELRRIWSTRTDWISTPSQVDRGVTDDHEGVRLAWSSRVDFIPTDAQAKIGLSDSRVEVAISWLRRMDYVISEDSVCDILRRDNPSIVKILLARHDWSPSSDQLVSGLAGHAACVNAWKDRARNDLEKLMEADQLCMSI